MIPNLKSFFLDFVSKGTLQSKNDCNNEVSNKITTIKVDVKGRFLQSVFKNEDRIKSNKRVHYISRPISVKEVNDEYQKKEPLLGTSQFGTPKPHDLRGTSHPRSLEVGAIHNPLVGGMSSRGKPGSNAKKVAPPMLPDGGNSSASSTCSSHRHSGSSLSSGVYSASDQRVSFCSTEESMPPPSPRSPSREATSEHGSMTDSSSGSRILNSNPSTASPSHYQTNQFTFPTSHQVPQFAHLMCPKASPGSPHHGPSDPTYGYIPFQHRQSMEDQGIDVQSPGRSSPGSGSGSSTSGSTGSSNCRNSTTSLDSGRASNSTLTHTHRLSGTSYDSNFMRHSYHSSSSSLGSMEPDSTAHINVHELMKNNVPDCEVLKIWLNDLHFGEYYENFSSAGYDMPTISRMTPEDLNAIGITKPSHRKRLKSEINRLNISDGLPDYIPARLSDWLVLLKLSEYAGSLKKQNYENVQQFTQITWEDLEDVGIKKLGHQKKVMLAIKRAKDIMCGKNIRISPDTPKISQFQTQEVHIHREKDTNNLPNMAAMNSFGHGFECRSNQENGKPHFRTLQHVPPSQIPFKYPGAFCGPDKSTLHYRPDVVTVHVKPNQSRTSNDEPIYSTFLPGPLPRSLGPLNKPPRSMDDGDITPTNDTPAYEGGGTLPRPNRLASKQRPIAKVTAKTRVDVHDAPVTPKKMPPPPPKRSNSISEHSKPKAPFYRGLSAGYIQTSLQPDLTSDLPPPPAPQDKGNHQHLPEDFPPPPPPLTCLTLAAHTNPSNDLNKDFVGKRNECNKSNSEVPESIPFANDNAGTIKQRSRTAFTLSRSSPRSSPLSSPALRRKEGVVLPIVRQPVYSTAVNEKIPVKDISETEPTSDVLNDIGNMLTNLTNELDAMIDQDRPIKN